MDLLGDLLLLPIGGASFLDHAYPSVGDWECVFVLGCLVPLLYDEDFPWWHGGCNSPLAIPT